MYRKNKGGSQGKVAKSAEARQQLSKCGNSLDIEEEAIEELFELTRLVEEEIFLNLSYQKTVRKMKAMKITMMRKTIVYHGGVMTHQNLVIWTP